MAQEMTQEACALSGGATTAETDSSPPTTPCPPKRLPTQVAEGARPTRRLRTDIRSEVDLNWGDSLFRDRFGLAPLTPSSERAPYVTTQAGLEVAFPNPMLRSGRHILFSWVTPQFPAESHASPPLPRSSSETWMGRAENDPITSAWGVSGARKADFREFRMPDRSGEFVAPSASLPFKVRRANERPVRRPLRNWIIGVRLGPFASGARARKMQALSLGLRRVGVRKILDTWSPPGHAGFPAFMNTDASLG